MKQKMQPLANHQSFDKTISLNKLEIINKHILLSYSDLEGNITDVTEAFLTYTGYTREELIGKNHSIFKHIDVEKKFIEKMWKVLHANKTWRGELKNARKNGEVFWIKITIEPLFDSQGQKIGYSALREDISNKKELEALTTLDPLTNVYNRRHFNELLTKYFVHTQKNSISFGLIIIDLDFFKLYNEKYSHHAGDEALILISKTLKRTKTVSKHHTFRLSGEEFAIIVNGLTEEIFKAYAQALRQEIINLQIPHEYNKVSDFLTVSIGAIHIDHSIEYSLNDIYNAADQNLYLAKKRGRNTVVCTSNIAKTLTMSEIDDVTHLPNRAKLTKDLEHLKADAMLVLLYVNDFSFFQETYGFEYCNEILLTKAKELRRILLDESATLYRLNINEFALLITDSNQFERYLSILQYSVLKNQVCDMHEDENKRFVVSFSAGISHGTHQILRKANMALHQAFKSMQSYSIYEEDVSILEYHKNRLQNLNVYQEALENDQIIPYFQPLVDAKNGAIVKYEALARIVDKTGKIITPNFFLDVAKEDKTFEYFTRQLFQKIFTIYSKNSVAFSVNITYQNIISPSFVQYLQNRLEKYGGDRITFEIIESEEILDYKAVAEFIAFVKKYGCKIAIDDFGSGYSNFSNLIRLDLDFIKIDGTIIEKLGKDKNVEIMAKSLISFAKDTHIKTIAEFVSSAEIDAKVKELDIDLLQGYFYGEPKPPQEYYLNI
jgi:diguanylate cyclase (GGDEF)-like protein/PAS domain S-box-containing protein